MKRLQEKQEEDRVRLEGKFKANMEAQRKLVEDMRRANLDERKANIAEAQALKDTIGRMRDAIDKKDEEMRVLQEGQTNCSLL